LSVERDPPSHYAERVESPFEIETGSQQHLTLLCFSLLTSVNQMFSFFGWHNSQQQRMVESPKVQPNQKASGHLSRLSARTRTHTVRSIPPYTEASSIIDLLSK
jgi:hypothetical protein